MVLARYLRAGIEGLEPFVAAVRPETVFDVVTTIAAGRLL
jgi:hypothetical protein